MAVAVGLAVGFRARLTGVAQLRNSIWRTSVVIHNDKWCPGCGGNDFANILVNEGDTGDLKCQQCGSVESPGRLSAGFPERTCKNPACGDKFPERLSHLITLQDGFTSDLRMGVIRCPTCEATHIAVNVYISESGRGTAAYRGAFGELRE
jgi:hypothetical protein